MNGFVIKGNILYSASMGKINVFPRHFLVCENGLCRGIFAELPDKYKDLPLHDYKDQMIIPGLTDLHIHAPQFGFRGTGMDMELLDWLDHQAFPEEAKYADEDYAKKAYSIFAEALKASATTRAVIFGTRHKAATECLMDLMEDTGLVTYVGKVNMDQNAPEGLREQSAEDSAAQTVEWLEDISGKYRYTRPILTPRFIPSCSRELLEKLKGVRKTYDLPVQSHLSENPEEIELVGKLFPEASFYGDCYDRYDLFGNRPGGKFTGRTVMAHCVYSSDAEAERIRRNDVIVAHCPASNLDLASGIAPIRKYLDMGLRVGLGSDVAGGQTESIFRAMTYAVQASKMYWRLVDQSAKPLTFEEVFYMATVGGGWFFGNVGKFEEGYEFDALILNDERFPHPQELSLHQRLERFAYLGGDMSGIEAKYVAGRKVK
ncbi:MAG: amidohydrolase family protein [Clostridiales bacterium]|nr:amidohydrolase family protein [Clostridiales bacterium]